MAEVTIRPLGPQDAGAAGEIFGACFATDPLYAEAIGFAPGQTARFMTLVSRLMLADPRCLGVGTDLDGRLATAALFAPLGWSPPFAGSLRACALLPELGVARVVRVLRALADSERHAPPSGAWRHLVYLGGRPESRGRGLGEALLSQALAVAPGCYLETLADNHGAIRFYERLGFAVTRHIRLLDVPHVQMVRPQ